MYIFFGNRCESWSWTDGILAVLYESQPLQEHERWTEWGWRSVWSPRTIAWTRLTSRGASRIWRPVFLFFCFFVCVQVLSWTNWMQRWSSYWLGREFSSFSLQKHQAPQLQSLPPWLLLLKAHRPSLTVRHSSITHFHLFVFLFLF